jgi:hypothetical protein
MDVERELQNVPHSAYCFDRRKGTLKSVTTESLKETDCW